MKEHKETERNRKKQKERDYFGIYDQGNCRKARKKAFQMGYMKENNHAGKDEKTAVGK